MIFLGERREIVKWSVRNFVEMSFSDAFWYTQKNPPFLTNLTEPESIELKKIAFQKIGYRVTTNYRYYNRPLTNNRHDKPTHDKHKTYLAFVMSRVCFLLC